MSIALITSNKQNILVEDNPLASGGEGAVHKIISPSQYSDCCVKLYLRQYRTRKREQKIRHMAQSPLPNLNGLKNGGCVICFPKELVYENNKSNRFAGFIMPLAFNGSNQLYELCIPKTKKLPSTWISKYDRCSSKGIESRLKLCVNIAAAINFIHSAGKYVLVDLKPQNILVTIDGKISVIDLDSTQIAVNNQVLYSAQVATPEYVPVEGNHLNPARDLIPESWDRFSLAVVFYEILFGLHPYAASYQGQYQNSNTVADSIRCGLFVHGSKKSYVYRKPPLHDNFNRIPSSLQNLFIKAFDAGHNNPSLRPKAEEWGRIIYSEVGNSNTQFKGFTTTIKSGQPQQSKTKPTYANQSKPKTTNTNQSNQQSSLYNQSPAITTTPSNFPNVGKIIGWVIALVILFWIGSGILSFIGNLATRRTQPANPPTQNRIVGTMREVNTINLNMRSGPGANYPVVATFSQRTRIVSYGETRTVDGQLWTQASTPDGQIRGWVNRRYLSP